MEGSAIKNLRMFQSLCGQKVLENVFLTTTQWSSVKPADGELRENKLRNGDFWGGLIRKGAALERFHGTRESGLELINKLKLKNPKPLDIQDQMVDQKMTLLETNAGQCINEELIAQEKKHKEEVESLEKERQEAIKAKDDEMNEILAEEQAKAQKKLEEAAAEKKLLAELHAAEIKKREAEERKRQEDIKASERALAAAQAENQRNLAQAAAEKKLLEEQHAAERRMREEERKRQEAIDREEREREKQEARDRQERLEAEMRKRDAKEKKEQEEARRREKSVIAVATKDISVAAHIMTLLSTYSTRGRWVYDINNHEEFGSNTFPVKIEYRTNFWVGVQVPGKTLLELGSEGMGSTNYILSDGVRYVGESGTIKRGGRDFVIFRRG